MLQEWTTLEERSCLSALANANFQQFKIAPQHSQNGPLLKWLLSWAAQIKKSNEENAKDDDDDDDYIAMDADDDGAEPSSGSKRALRGKKIPKKRDDKEES